MTIPQRILAALADGEMTCADIASRMPDVKKGSLAPAIVRLFNDGRLEQPLRGSYRVAGQFTALRVSAADIRAHVIAMPPGKVFGYADLMRDLAATHSNLTCAIGELLAAGYVTRVVRGTYARSGGTVRMTRSNLPRYAQAVRIMQGRKGPSTTAQVHANLPDPTNPKEGVYILHNMQRAGLVDRVAPGTWLLTEKGRGYLEPETRTDPTTVVLDALRPGSLLRSPDIAEATGLTHATVSAAIDRLEAAGSVVHVIYGLWRRASAATGLEAYGMGLVEFLAPILASDGAYTSGDFHRDHGISVRDSGARLTALVNEGIVIQVGYGVKRMNPAWRMALNARLTSVRDRPHLTPLGARMVAALRHEGPLRKSEIAARAGTNRGVAIRLVDRLVAEGRMLEVAPGRFMLG